MSSSPDTIPDAIQAALAAGKLAVDHAVDGDVAYLQFVGTIDEQFAGAATGGAIEAGSGALVVDLGGVKKISSFGIREWVDFLAAARQRAREVILVECAPKVVDQMNMVANFAAGARVYSLYAPFRCDFCDRDHRVLLQVDRDADAIKAMHLPERPCPACKQAMYFDDDGAAFFSYVASQPRVELAPAVAAFLASRFDYALADGSRKLRVDKVVDGRATYVSLAGDLDGAFPADKIADGLEGEVFIDVSGIARIDPPGAAAWRTFIALVTPAIEKLYVAGAPSAFRERLGGDLGARGALLDAAPDAAELRARLDELRGRAAANRPSSSRLLAGRPATAPLGASSAHLVRAPSSAAARRTPLWVPLAAALLALALAGGAVAVYLAVARSHEASHTGDVDARSAAARPAWVTDATGCTASGSGSSAALACVGVSSPRAAQDDAEDEAADAAYDALAAALAARIPSAVWRARIPPLYTAARDAKLAAFARDPGNTVARRAVLDARRAVAQLFRGSGGPPAPSAHYWERRVAADAGKVYVASAQLVLAPADIARLAAAYTREASALGAVTLDVFPELGWRYPHLEHGAVVVSVGDGLVKDIGIAAGYVVIAVDGAAAGNARAFADMVTAATADRAAHGGVLGLGVLAGDGDAAPREFTRTYAPPAGAPPLPPPPPPAVPTGGINVWDRYGGGRPK